MKMKLERFEQNNKKKFCVIGILAILFLSVIGVILYRSYALYQEKKTFNVLSGKVPYFSDADILLTFTINGEASGDAFPDSSLGYKVNSTTCDNGVTAEFDSTSWGLINIESNGKLNIKCNVDFGKEYKEDILNGADPVLADNLIPVTIANDGTVTKADTTTEWYNYGNKIWANAVILLDKSKTYADNETIPESNIESYFVWIPKYSYQLWDLGTYTGLTSLDNSKPHIIPIKFGTGNTSDSVSGECTTPGTSGGSGNCAVGEYMTPPAFTTMGTNGIWVGKFETGYKGASSISTAEINTSDSTKVQIKPNVYSWRNITVGNIFTTVYNYQRSMDSHMMKNTEWAVAAMLSHTKYGKGSEVWINNNSKPVTGCVGASASASPASSCNAYNSTNGFQGSSTGNISGIYDMSGGAWEYMAGYINGNTESAELIPSNYDSKYFDIYSSSSTTISYQYRILGDLTGELGPFQDSSGYRSSWYSDYAYFVRSGLPWFLRSGNVNNSAGAGAFYFTHDTGGVRPDGGFRVVLAP